LRCAPEALRHERSVGAGNTPRRLNPCGGAGCTWQMTLLWGRATHLRRLGPRVRVRELTAFFRKRLPLRSVSALSVALFCWSSAGQAAAAEGEPRSRPVELGLSSGYSVVGFGHRLQADDFDTLWGVVPSPQETAYLDVNLTYPACTDPAFLKEFREIVQDAWRGMD